MKFLCGISAWETNVATRGRGVGNVITKRPAVAFDNWNIVIGTQRGGTDESPIFGECFVPSMRLLLPFIAEQVQLCEINAIESLTFLAGVERNEAISNVIAALERLTGKKAPRVELSLLQTRSELEGYGKQIDDRFGTNFCIHPVQKNMFGADAEEEEAPSSTSSNEPKKRGRPCKAKAA